MRPEERDYRLLSDGGSESVIERDAGESTTEAIVRAIATLDGVAETDLRPLYEEVELEALENIVQHAHDRDQPVSVRFTVAEYTVCVRGDDTIRIVDSSHSLALDRGSRAE